MSGPNSFFPVSEVVVRSHRGSPALWINGRPHTGLTFFFGRVYDADVDVRAFERAGVHLYSGCVGAADIVQPDGSFRFDEARRRFDYVIAANPRVLILPRLGLDWGVPRSWFSDRYPEELQVDLDPATLERTRSGRASFSSLVWRDLADRALVAFVRFCEESYGEHILGYHLGAGDCGEWSYSWRAPLSDYSAPHTQAFRAWLRKRYDNDPRRLADAWADERSRFDTAEVPVDRTRRKGQMSLLDPSRERRIIDYMIFHSEAVADTILHFANITKRTLSDMGRRKLCGFFYGYHFKNLNKPHCYFNQGHFAQESILASPDIDFLCAPYNYSGREQGGPYAPQLLAASVRLHGKIPWAEDDTFTHLSRREPHRAWCPDLHSTLGVLRRNAAGVVREGGSAWWMDCGGNGPPDPEGRQVHGWYRDPSVMSCFGDLERWARSRLDASDRSPAAQVACLVSDAAVARMRQDEALVDPLVLRQLLELGAMGASFDCYRTEDLPLLLERPWSARYQLVLVPGSVYLSSEERGAFERLKSGGRTILWIYAPGLVTEDALSVEAASLVAGFRLGIRHRDECLLVATAVAGTRVLYGTERQVNPVVFGRDPDAQVLGWYVNTGDPGFMCRSYPDWHSIWSGAPCVPASILRWIARKASVHLYLETGDQVIADHGSLCVHSLFDGDRTVELPDASDVYDAVTGGVVARAARRFTVRLARAQTAMWRIERTVPS